MYGLLCILYFTNRRAALSQLRVTRLTAWLSSETPFVVRRKCCSSSMGIADCQSLLYSTVVKIRGRREKGRVGCHCQLRRQRDGYDKNRITCFRDGASASATGAVVMTRVTIPLKMQYCTVQKALLKR